MDESADGDVGQRHCIAGLDVGIGTGDDHIAYMKTLRMKDVALLAVDVMKERDAGGAVGVVLDGSDLGGHAVLVALEVDDTVTTLVAAALMTGGDATVVVAACLLRQRRKERLLGLVRGDLGKVGDHLETTSGTSRLVLLDSHSSFPFLGLSANSQFANSLSDRPSLARLVVHRRSLALRGHDCQIAHEEACALTP